MAEQQDKAQGKTKEVAGKVSGNERLESEGRTQRNVAKGKESVENAGAKARGIMAGIKEKFKK